MKTIRYLALALGGIGLAVCAAGLIAIWTVRPAVLRSGVELLDATDDGLNLVQAKTMQADELVSKIRTSVDPITSRIGKLTDKIDRTPEDEKELSSLRDELAERLREVDVIADIAETATAFLNKTSRLTRSLRLPGTRFSRGESSEEDSQESTRALSRVKANLKELREALPKLRGDEERQTGAVGNLVRTARDLDENLALVSAKLQDVNQQATDWGTQVAKLRTALPTWTIWAALAGTVILAWMGLGQYFLLRWSWDRTGADRPA